MLVAVKMPDLGTASTDLIAVSHWLADEGDEVWEGQDLVEVHCQEIAFCLPCPVEGRLVEARLYADEPVEPGQVMAVIDAPDEHDTPWDNTDDEPKEA